MGWGSVTAVDHLKEGEGRIVCVTWHKTYQKLRTAGQNVVLPGNCGEKAHVQKDFNPHVVCYGADLPCKHGCSRFGGSISVSPVCHL